jgi:hypothetical protein
MLKGSPGVFRPGERTARSARITKIPPIFAVGGRGDPRDGNNVGISGGPGVWQDELGARTRYFAGAYLRAGHQSGRSLREDAVGRCASTECTLCWVATSGSTSVICFRPAAWPETARRHVLWLLALLCVPNAGHSTVFYRHLVTMASMHGNGGALPRACPVLPDGPGIHGRSF